MATENIITGRKYRILSDAVNQIWDRISFWNKASDTEADDGSTLEYKVGAINGITDALDSEDSSIAASSVAVKNLNDSLASGQISFDVVDGEPYVAVNGGTPRPFDSRHFIVKNGVAQDGYTDVAPSNRRGTVTLVDDYGGSAYITAMATTTGTDAIYMLIPIDVTEINYIKIDWHYDKIYYYFELVTESEKVAAATRQSNGSIIDTRDLSGTYYIRVAGYSGNYPCYIKDIWYE